MRSTIFMDVVSNEVLWGIGMPRGTELTEYALLDGGVLATALLPGAPNHVEAKSLLDAVRAGALAGCTTSGALGGLYATLSRSGDGPLDDIARQVRALVEPPSSLLVLISGLEASLKMLELAARHALAPERLHTARDAATALAAGVSIVYTYDVDAWEPFLADGLHIGGPSSVMARWFRRPGSESRKPARANGASGHS